MNLIIHQLYRELMTVADEHASRLSSQCVFYANKFRPIPKVKGGEMMFSTARSRGLTIVAIVQGIIQSD